MDRQPLTDRLGDRLLAEYGGAAAAYSLRALNGNGDNVVRVRRAIDNDEEDFTALQISDGTLESFCGVGDGFVATWYDQSGNGNDATQSVAGSQPKIVDGGSLVAGGIDFDGAGNYFNVSGINEAQPITGFIQLKPDAVGDATNDVLDGTLVNTNRILLDASSGNWRLFAGSVLTGASVATTPSLLYFLANSTGSEFGLNGATALTGNAGTNSGWANGLTIGTSISGGFYDGTMGEIIIYPSDQSANRTAIEGNINAHYEIYP